MEIARAWRHKHLGTPHLGAEAAFLGVLAMAILSFGLMFHLYFLNDAYVQLTATNY